MYFIRECQVNVRMLYTVSVVLFKREKYTLFCMNTFLYNEKLNQYMD